MATLLGGNSGTKVSRYENFARLPSVNTIWAYEIVFNQPAADLFAGDYRAIRVAVQLHAKVLIEQLASQAPRSSSSRTERKLALLRSIVESKPTGGSAPRQI
jgi:hypothetical protein